MPLTTIFAEKPSQAKAYADAFKVKNRTKTHIEIYPNDIFPKGAFITWGVGHLVELQQPHEYKEEWRKWTLKDLPIIPDKFVEKVSNSTKSQYNAVKELFKETEKNKGLIINAVDCDREGSSIFYSVLQKTGVKDVTIKRLWINSLESEEIKKGFNNLHDIEKDLLMFDEAKARQIADFIVGINASRCYSIGLGATYSIGRIQSPSVYLIYQRQLEIENFVPKAFYEIEADFTAENGIYKGKAEIKSDNKEEVINLIKNHKINEQNEGFVKSIIKKERRTKSPKLHALSTLQATANKNWKYSPSDVLKLTQSLYERKLVTYPRTDTQFITENEFTYLLNNVEAYQKIAGIKFDINSTEPNKRYVDGKKVQEHYAIVATKNIPSESTIKGLSQEEKNIYFEILNTTLAMFHADYIYEETKIITDVNGLEFHTKGNTEKSKGWKEIFKNNKNNDDGEKMDSINALPSVKNQEKVVSVVDVKEGLTTSPKPYTEGQLIGMMKTCGKSVENEEDMAILKEIEGLGTEATRSGIIETIKAQKYIEVKNNIVSITNKGRIMCKAIEGSLLSSPTMTAKWESYLKKIGKGEGSKEAFIKQAIQFVTKLVEDVPKTIKSTAISSLIQEDQQSKYIVKCPTCKNGHISDRKTFFGCTAYSEGCKTTFPKKYLGKTLSEAQIKLLVEKKTTNLIKGFKSKQGNKFDAFIILKDDKSIGLKFK